MKIKISEITSLRFVAVLLVFLFHLNPHIFPGGYIGVDVFFVISGYVISLQIFGNGVDRLNFNISDFYKKRFIRLMPPFLLLVLACLVCGFVVLLPFNYEFHIQSYLTSLTFSSNILFWRKIDYFLSDQIFNPFIHTWSLSLEWQFYLFFPFIIYFLNYCSKKYITSILWFLIILSLVLSFVVNAYGMFSFSFYNLPTRFFEFLIGILFSYYFSLKQFNFLVKRPIKLFLLIFSLVIFFTQLFFNYLSPYFPHFSSFFVAGLSGCLIYSFSDEKPISSIFNCKLFNFLGDISYSTYLWHFPIILFSGYYFPITTNSIIRYTVVILLTLLFSSISYFFVEKNKSLWAFKKTFIFYVIMVFLGTLLLIFHNRLIIFFEQKLYSNYSFYNKIKKSSDIGHLKNTYFSSNCVADKYSLEFEKLIIRKYKPENTVIVFGDSHAINLYNALARSNSEKKYNIVGIVSGGCSISFQNKDCEMSSVLNFLRKYPFKSIIYTEASFRLFLNGSEQSDRAMFLDSSLLSKLNVDTFKVRRIFSTLSHLGKNVVFVSPWPDYFVRNSTRDYIDNYFHPIRSDIIFKMRLLDNAFNKEFMTNRYNIRFINTLQFWGENSIDAYGYPKYCDFDHLSIYGESFLGSQLNILNF